MAIQDPPRALSGTCCPELLRGRAYQELLLDSIQGATQKPSLKYHQTKLDLFESNLQFNRLKLFGQNICVEVYEHVVFVLATKLKLVIAKLRRDEFDLADPETGRANFAGRRSLCPQHPVVRKIRRVFQPSNAERDFAWLVKKFNLLNKAIICTGLCRLVMQMRWNLLVRRMFRPYKRVSGQVAPVECIGQAWRIFETSVLFSQLSSVKNL